MKPHLHRTDLRATVAWIQGLFALITAGWLFVAASCDADAIYQPPGGAGQNTSVGPGPSCIGPTCPERCAAHPVPGCACDEEGQHLLCGHVEATYPGAGSSPGATVCGQGFSVCSGGRWGECQINGSVMLVPDAPEGFWAKGLSTGTVCAQNPCDPSCTDFQDTPSGITGTGLKANDGGVSLLGDGGTACVPKSCAALGFNCGVQSDGCGHTIDCGTCAFPSTCGGGGTPSVCGVSSTCTNLCLKQVKCPSNGTTSISGTVYMPNGVTPLANVLVYVPNGTLSAFTAQVACVTGGNCTSEVSGSPLVATTSATDGTFTLNNVPAGVSFDVVIQLGRFRRKFTMPAVTACTNTVVPCTSASACLSRFARSQNETSAYDNIPKMAFMTGCVDALECVWRKVGIASTGAPGAGGTSYNTGEFTPGATGGRINLFAGAGCPGTYITDIPNTTPWDISLLSDPTTLAKYDMLLFPCQHAQYYYPSQTTYQTNIANFVNAGGRVFATHYSYIWLITDPGFGYGPYTSPLSPAINWNINASYTGADPTTGYINTSFPGGAQLASWLMVPAVGGSTTYGEMSINTIRHDFDSVNPPTQTWVTLGPKTCTATTGDADNCGACGNVCASGQVCSSGACKATCGAGLTTCGRSCVSTSNDPKNCGACGNVCGAGQTCTAGACTCPAGFTKCGSACVATSTDPNNCGACGTACSGGKVCVSGACTCPPGHTTTCSGSCVSTVNDNDNCGSCGNGCGGTKKRCQASTCVSSCSGGLTDCSRDCVNTATDVLNCGGCGNVCPAGTTCSAGACSACPAGTTACNGVCVSLTDPNNCGACGNACGNGQTCAGGTCTCSAGTACAGGIPQQASFNTPLGSALDSQCGRVVFSDFHVESSTNANYPFPSECGAGAFSPQELMLAQALFDLAGCVSLSSQPACVPITCGYLGLTCGTAGDGCGGTLDCGSCTAPASCGGGGVPGVCGVPQTYSAASFVRDYDASTRCPDGQRPVWRSFSWAATTPKDAKITFTIATADTLAGLATAPSYTLGWSDPPGIPAGLTAGAPAIAHALGQPAGSPDTQLGGASPDATLAAQGEVQNNYYLRVVATLTPSSDMLSTPVLASWDMQISCAGTE